MITLKFQIKSFIVISLFAIAMGYLETSVVVFLRALLYPNGFAFPLAPIPENLALTELLREAATMIMLIGIGYFAGKNFYTRFAWFIYAFAVWDIFYYVFLKLLLHWPESWLTWDILFLIPVVWVGPVIAPIIVSLSMILLAVLVIYKDHTNQSTKIHPMEWGMFIVGSLVLILSFTWEYSVFIFEKFSFSKIWTIPSAEYMALSQNYIPQKFNWLLFCSGLFIINTGIVIYGIGKRNLHSLK